MKTSHWMKCLTSLRTWKLGRLSAVFVGIVLAGHTSAVAEGRFLTEPAEGEPMEIALSYLEEHHGELGLSQTDLIDFVVSDQHVSRRSGVTNIYLQQRLAGVEVVNGILNVHVMPDGRIVHLGNSFVADLSSKANTRSPSLLPEEAIGRAATHLRIEPATGPVLLEVVGGADMEAIYDGSGISRESIPVRLMYLPVRSGQSLEARLVWSLVVRQVNSSNWWNMFVDATDGRMLEKHNWTVDEAPSDSAGRRAGATPATRAPGFAENSDTSGETTEGCSNNCYNVYAIPLESPEDGPRTIENNPATLASPFGWHDTNGAAGAEFTDTRGNNAFAQEDRDGNNSGGFRPNGGSNLIFDFPLDLGLPPVDYQAAAITNLFYWNNIMHDVTYEYGFDEPGGNFQENNYGNGGAEGDPVQADAQDGSGCNNANFSTPPDGIDGRMQMFEWFAVPNGKVTVNSPGIIAGDYAAARGCWGAELDPPVTDDLEIVDDGTGATATQGCNALVGFTAGNIALIDRGGCEFGVKGLNAETAGATGAIIVNDQQLPNGIISMGAGVSGGAVTIPAVMIGSADGTTIRNEVPTVNATIAEDPAVNQNRDSDLDNGIIAHEYGHGISNRLVGGPANTGCLSGDEQMGEGMSDFWTLVLTAKPGQTGTDPRGVGSYTAFNTLGIRNFPYSTDLAVNPQTYADVDGTNIPHGVGEVWNAMVWEVYWLLVAQEGFDTDFYNGTGGNNIAIQLVVDSMKLQPCASTFIDNRDAMLAADQANYGGAYECAIWRGFAKRGAGVGASGGTTAVGDEVESFVVPDGSGGMPDCFEMFADGFESGDVSAWGSTVP